ncbi:MFS transporter [Micromonospora vulcania]|uniref:MFS transporter n=1 Tax=Micromonospora vulcania TaxID=1441873 RepID=A0ABW1H2R3_9ACTN
MIRGNRAYQIFLVATLLSFIGSTIHVVAASWLILQLTGAAYSVPLLLLFSAVPGVLLAPIVGSVVDRFDSRRLLVGVDVVSAAAVFSIPLISAAHLLAPWHLYVVESVLAVCGQFYGSASRVFVRRLASDKDLLRANATTTLVYQIGIAVGALVGGLVVAASGPQTGLVVNGASFLISAIGMMVIRRTRRQQEVAASTAAPSSPPGTWAGFARTIRLITSSSRIWQLTLLYVGLQAMHRLLSSLLAPFVSSTGNGAGTQGGLQMVYSLGSIVAGTLIPTIWKRFGSVPILICGAIGVPALAVAFSVARVQTGSLLLYGLLGLAVSAWIYHLTAAQLLVPDDQQGTYFATTGSLVSLAGIAVFGASTLLLHVVTPATAYRIGAVALLVSAVPMVLALRRRSAPEPTDQEPGGATSDSDPDQEDHPGGSGSRHPVRNNAA